MSSTLHWLRSIGSWPQFGNYHLLCGPPSQLSITLRSFFFSMLFWYYFVLSLKSWWSLHLQKFGLLLTVSYFDYPSSRKKLIKNLPPSKEKSQILFRNNVDQNWRLSLTLPSIYLKINQKRNRFRDFFQAQDTLRKNIQISFSHYRKIFHILTPYTMTYTLMSNKWKSKLSKCVPTWWNSAWRIKNPSEGSSLEELNQSLWQF